MKSILQRLYDGEIYSDELIISKDPKHRPVNKKIEEEKVYNMALSMPGPVAG